MQLVSLQLVKHARWHMRETCIRVAPVGGVYDACPPCYVIISTLRYCIKTLTTATPAASCPTTSWLCYCITVNIDPP